jgi:acyl carrier protein
MADIDAELIAIIAEEALIEPEVLKPEATLADIGVDSVGLVSVVFAVEDKYGVSIAEDAFTDARTVADFLGVLKAAIAQG